MISVLPMWVLVFFISGVKPEVTIMETATRFRYQVEKHDVATEDGYQLSVHRILPREPGLQKPPVLLMHGLFSSGMDFLVLGPGRALGFLLSAFGYDVWLGSVRGIPGSTGHVNQTINAADYWDFSLDEVSKYDIPAIVDEVLTKTGQKSVSYIGHSMGTVLIMMMLAELPRYIEKISMVILLSPVVFISNPDPILIAARRIMPVLKELLTYAKEFNFPSNYEDLRKIGTALVNTHKGFDFLKRSMEFIFGKDCHLSELVLKDLFSHIPTPASTRLLLHYSQIIGTESLRKFDWGLRRNLEMYRSTRPPNYDLSKITTSVFLFKGNTDIFTSQEDVEKLEAVLPNSTTFFIQARQFAHHSFVYSDTADEFVYKYILLILQHRTLPILSESPDVCDVNDFRKLPGTWNILDTC